MNRLRSYFEEPKCLSSLKSELQSKQKIWKSEKAFLVKLQRQFSQLEGDEPGLESSQKPRVHFTITAKPTKTLLHSAGHNYVANSRNKLYLILNLEIRNLLNLSGRNINHNILRHSCNNTVNNQYPFTNHFAWEVLKH